MANYALHVGKTPLPAWVTTTPVNTWLNVNTATSMPRLSTLDPKDRSDLNPNYPSSPEWQGTSGQKYLFEAWNGACYDETNDVLWAPLQGGHTDYGGNEPYKLALNTNTPGWVMLRPPTGVKPDNVVTQDGAESSGVYTGDGRPRSVHSYNKPVFVPGSGPWLGITGAAWHSTAGVLKPLFVNPNTGEGTYGSAIGAGIAPLVSETSNGGACYDSTRGAIWFRVAATGYIFKYVIATDTWTREGPSKALSGPVSLVYNASKDLIIMSCSLGLVIYDPVATTYTTCTTTGSTTGAAIYTESQLRWTGTDFAWWNNATNTTIISKLTPPTGDWKSGTWTLGEYTVSGANTVTPDAKIAAGTYGRFMYSSNFNGFLLQGDAHQDLFFFKL